MSMPKYKSAFITTNKRLEDQQIRLEHMDSTASKKLLVSSVGIITGGCPYLLPPSPQGPSQGMCQL